MGLEIPAVVNGLEVPAVVSGLEVPAVVKRQPDTVRLKDSQTQPNTAKPWSLEVAKPWSL